jgi:hypothetical protein
MKPKKCEDIFSVSFLLLKMFHADSFEGFAVSKDENLKISCKANDMPGVEP